MKKRINDSLDNNNTVILFINEPYLNSPFSIYIKRNTSPNTENNNISVTEVIINNTLQKPTGEQVFENTIYSYLQDIYKNINIILHSLVVKMLDLQYLKPSTISSEWTNFWEQWTNLFTENNKASIISPINFRSLSVRDRRRKAFFGTPPPHCTSEYYREYLPSNARSRDGKRQRVGDVDTETAARTIVALSDARPDTMTSTEVIAAAQELAGEGDLSMQAADAHSDSANSDSRVAAAVTSSLGSAIASGGVGARVGSKRGSDWEGDVSMGEGAAAARAGGAVGRALDKQPRRRASRRQRFGQKAKTTNTINQSSDILPAGYPMTTSGTNYIIFSSNRINTTSPAGFIINTCTWFKEFNKIFNTESTSFSSKVEYQKIEYYTQCIRNQNPRWAGKNVITTLQFTQSLWTNLSILAKNGPHAVGPAADSIKNDFIAGIKNSDASKLLMLNNSKEWNTSLSTAIISQLQFLTTIIYINDDYSNEIKMNKYQTPIWSPLQNNYTGIDMFEPDRRQIIKNWVNFNFYYLFNFLDIEAPTYDPITSTISPILNKSLIAWRKNNYPDTFVPQPKSRCIWNAGEPHAGQDISICKKCSSPADCSSGQTCTLNLPTTNIDCSSEEKCINKPPLLSDTAINTVSFGGENNNTEYFKINSKEYFSPPDISFDLYNGIRPFTLDDTNTKKFLVKNKLGQKVNWWFAQTIAWEVAGDKRPSCSYVKTSKIIDINTQIKNYKEGLGYFLEGPPEEDAEPQKWLGPGDNTYLGEPNPDAMTGPQWSIVGVTTVINFYNAILTFIWVGPPEADSTALDKTNYITQYYNKWLYKISNYELPAPPPPDAPTVPTSNPSTSKYWNQPIAADSWKVIVENIKNLNQQFVAYNDPESSVNESVTLTVTDTEDEDYQITKIIERIKLPTIVPIPPDVAKFKNHFQKEKGTLQEFINNKTPSQFEKRPSNCTTLLAHMTSNGFNYKYAGSTSFYIRDSKNAQYAAIADLSKSSNSSLGIGTDKLSLVTDNLSKSFTFANFANLERIYNFANLLHTQNAGELKPQAWLTKKKAPPGIPSDLWASLTGAYSHDYPIPIKDPNPTQQAFNTLYSKLTAIKGGPGGISSTVGAAVAPNYYNSIINKNGIYENGFPKSMPIPIFGTPNTTYNLIRTCIKTPKPDDATDFENYCGWSCSTAAGELENIILPNMKNDNEFREFRNYYKFGAPAYFYADSLSPDLEYYKSKTKLYLDTLAGLPKSTGDKI